MSIASRSQSLGAPEERDVTFPRKWRSFGAQISSQLKL
jgi:hypothetical protein